MAVYQLKMYNKVSNDVGTKKRQKPTCLQVVTSAAASRVVVEVCCGNELLLTTMPHLLEQLELCQKSLSAYLEAKRSEFPRFFFVSDPVLLEILSLGSNPAAVVPHFQSGLFDSLSNVTFDAVRIDWLMLVPVIQQCRVLLLFVLAINVHYYVENVSCCCYWCWERVRVCMHIKNVEKHYPYKEITTFVVCSSRKNFAPPNTSSDVCPHCDSLLQQVDKHKMVEMVSQQGERVRLTAPVEAKGTSVFYCVGHRAHHHRKPLYWCTNSITHLGFDWLCLTSFVNDWCLYRVVLFASLLSHLIRVPSDVLPFVQ